MKFPLYVPTFNNPTYTNNFIEQVKDLDFERIIIMDNNSTYPEMIELLAKLEKSVEVIRFSENLGPHFILKNPEYYSSLPEVFCLSDPDVQISKKLPKNFQEIMYDIAIKHQFGKIGFAIEIPEYEEFLEPVIRLDGELWNMSEWESQFWKDEIDKTESGDSVYATTLDTQFAIYNKQYFNPEDRYRALRVAGKFTCKHLGFYKDSIVPKDEANYYKMVSKFAYYIGNFDEDGTPYTKLPVHDYYLLVEKLEGSERELKRIALERDDFLNQLIKIYDSRTWKLFEPIRMFKRLIKNVK